MYQYQTVYVYSMPGTKTATDAEAALSSFTVAIRVRYSASACEMFIWSQGQSGFFSGYSGFRAYKVQRTQTSARSMFKRDITCFLIVVK